MPIIDKPVQTGNNHEGQGNLQEQLQNIEREFQHADLQGLK